ncbi:MAG: hypothetical protein EXR48_04910 [Dehalococcoidia bacterium]|nr:hypothetical protein [Dehalococcoidia bacterium]
MTKDLQVVLVVNTTAVIAATVEWRDVVHFHTMPPPPPNHSAEAIGPLPWTMAAPLARVSVPFERSFLGRCPLMILKKHLGASTTTPLGLSAGQRFCAARQRAMAKPKDQHAALRPPLWQHLSWFRHS